MVRYAEQRSEFDVAILLATYNGEKYISYQLESIAAQTDQNFICFIHDDMSQDSTVEIVKNYCSSHPEHFLFLGSSKCGSAKKNFMLMMTLVKADYIMFCDQDDFWMSEKIEKNLTAIRELEQKFGSGIPYCVYSDLKMVNAELKETDSSYFQFTGKNPHANTLKDLLRTNVVVGCTMIINSELQNMALKVQNLDHIFMHDWWCVLICSINGKCSVIEEPLVLYRQHDNNEVGAQEKHNFYRKLKNLLNLKQWSIESKNNFKRQQNFAKELVKITSKSNRYYNFLLELANLEKEKWLKRAEFYFHNDLFIENKNKLLQIFLV